MRQPGELRILSLAVSSPESAFALALAIAFAVAAMLPAQAQTYTVLHNFSGSEGAYPDAGLTLAGTGTFYGTASGGGSAVIPSGARRGGRSRGTRFSPLGRLGRGSFCTTRELERVHVPRRCFVPLLSRRRKFRDKGPDFIAELARLSGPSARLILRAKWGCWGTAPSRALAVIGNPSAADGPVENRQNFATIPIVATGVCPASAWLHEMRKWRNWQTHQT